MKQSLLVNETLWGLVNTFIRVSAALFIIKVFGGFVKVMFIAKLIIILSILYGIVVILEIFLVCRPLAMAWDSQIKGRCGNQLVSYVSLEAIGLFLDSAIMIVSILPIWKQNLKLARKIATTILFSLGVL
jgi:hypothetical protein